jgi:hypothetical protein
MNWYKQSQTEDQTLTVGKEVNITQMEGGGTYIIEKVNPNGIVDVKDCNDRKMQVKKERIYPIGAKPPKPNYGRL